MSLRVLSILVIKQKHPTSLILKGIFWLLSTPITDNSYSTRALSTKWTHTKYSGHTKWQNLATVLIDPRKYQNIYE